MVELSPRFLSIKMSICDGVNLMLYRTQLFVIYTGLIPYNIVTDKSQPLDLVEVPSHNQFVGSPYVKSSRTLDLGNGVLLHWRV